MMTDVLKFGPAIIHPAAIREVFVEDGTTTVHLITDVSHFEKECDSEEEALATVNKIGEYLNIVEEI